MEPASGAAPDGAAPSLAEPRGYLSILAARTNRQLSATLEETSADEGDTTAEEPRKSASPSPESPSKEKGRDSKGRAPKLSLQSLLSLDLQGKDDHHSPQVAKEASAGPSGRSSSPPRNRGLPPTLRSQSQKTLRRELPPGEAESPGGAAQGRHPHQTPLEVGALPPACCC